MTLVGTKLGKYEIVEEIGHGGMATVYRAYQPSLNRYVAIKVLSGQLAKDETFRQRFAREAKAVAQLSHPNILPIYDFGEQPALEALYIVTELIEGGTLKARLGAPLNAHEAVRLAAEIARSLDYAHRRGIVHRDVKPNNVLLADDGRALLTDFGIAKMVAGTQYTQTGTSVGTPTYMSPEQAKGQEIDGRSDVYSLGIMLYEMLTGRVPFQGDTPLAVAHQQVFEPPPPPRQFNRRIPKRLEKVLLRALAKDREKRFRTGSDFARALERAVGRQRLAIFTGRTGPSGDPGATEAAQPHIIRDTTPAQQLARATATRTARVGKGIGKLVWRAIVWLLRTLGAVVVVFIIAVALLGAVLVWGGARLAERSIQQVEWHTEYLPLDTEYAMTEEDFLSVAEEGLAPYALDSVTDLAVDFRSPDEVVLGATVWGRRLRLQGRLSAPDGIPQVQLEQLNDFPLYVVGGVLSRGINRGLSTAFADEPVHLIKLQITEQQIAVRGSRNPDSDYPWPTATPTPLPTPTPTATPVPRAELTVANELDETVTLKIGDQQLTIPAGGHGELSLPPGSYFHRITIPGYEDRTGVSSFVDGSHEWIIR
jgi:serine/threonine-protein kinase